MIVSNTLNVKEILKIYLIEQKIYPNHQDEWYVYHSDLSRYVSDCTVVLLYTTLTIYFKNSTFFVDKEKGAGSEEM